MVTQCMASQGKQVKADIYPVLNVNMMTNLLQFLVVWEFSNVVTLDSSHQ